MNETDIQNKIGYIFSDKSLLEKALTHSSFKKRGENYEKLEFFGDSFLNFVIAKHLFETRSELSVGDMTKLRAQIVCTENLKNATKRLGLWEHVRRADNMRIQDQSKKLFADIFESIVGGIYCDGGEAESEKFILWALSEEIANTLEKDILIDYKTTLQEYVQGRKIGEIFYKTCSVLGEGHKPYFEIALLVGGVEVSRGSGENKKKASQICAKLALEKYGVLK